MKMSVMKKKRVNKKNIHKKKVNSAELFWSTAIQVVVIALVVAIVLLNVFNHVMPVARYYGTGMEPTLHDRQILFIWKTDRVEAGDMVLFYYNNKVLVRRVICEGGKQISIDEMGTVFINAEELEEPYLEQKSLGQCNISFPCNVPIGQFFVMGDARDKAMDSRLQEIGTIAKERIIGKVLFAF